MMVPHSSCFCLSGIVTDGASSLCLCVALPTQAKIRLEWATDFKKTSNKTAQAVRTYPGRKERKGKSLFQKIQGEQFMKLRIAIATFAMLGICSVVTTRMSASTPESLPTMLFGGGGPVPCPPIGCLSGTNGVSQSSSPQTRPAMFVDGGGGPTPCPPKLT